MTDKKTYLILFNLPLMPNLDLALLLETYSQTITSNVLVDEVSKGSFVFYFTLGLALVFLGFFGSAWSFDPERLRQTRWIYIWCPKLFLVMMFWSDCYKK